MTTPPGRYDLAAWPPPETTVSPDRRRELRRAARLYAARELEAALDEAGDIEVHDRYPAPGEAQIILDEFAAVIRRIRATAA
ncbi:hypothetical protein [Kitasatospora cineracea]|uniref:Uncharacterized protein n=1 Tax=Kitasatospora cineracea TaxID=88074 RepID=A0A3N4R7K1_9ACTN|nr:hypothetical protein [Kitasatospora cineracea]RPE27339.1 hypothetical protein EDD38_7484 [Kitasatospora cineracea]